ncbi:unnamed protein product [Ectocarpus sp. 12 AP-2014]
MKRSRSQSRGFVPLTKTLVPYFLFALVCILGDTGTSAEVFDQVALRNEPARRVLPKHHHRASQGCLNGITGGAEHRGEHLDDVRCGDTSAGPHQHPMLATIFSVSFLVGIIIFILVCMS